MRAGGSGMDWNDEIVGRLRRLWDEGHSTAEIGRRLGVSKNAVIGKVHRLDLPGRLSPIRRGASSGPRPARPIVPKLTEIMPLKACATPPTEQRVAIQPRPTSARLPSPEPRSRLPVGTSPCCWPLGDSGTCGFRFCDDAAIVSKPYCEDHARTAYRKPRRRDEPAQPGVQAE